VATSTKAGAEEGRAGRSREIAGLLLFAMVAFLAAALMSWQPDDPCLTSTSLASRNWMGPVGAHVAGFLMELFGYGSWVLLILVVIAAAPLVFSGLDDETGLSHKVAGAILIFLGAVVSLGLLGEPGGQEADSIFSMAPGGAVGSWAADILKRWIGPVGAALFAFVMVSCGLMMATPFSFARLFSLMRGGLFRLVGGSGKEGKGPGTELSPSSSKLPEGQGQGVGAVPRIKEAPSEGPRIKSEEELKRDGLGEDGQLQKASGPDGESDGEDDEFKIAPLRADYELPPVDLLQSPPEKAVYHDKELFFSNAETLEKKLRDFGVKGKVVEISPGPVVTMYEFEPAPGVKINKVASLADDLALALKTRSVRIVAPIPGKAVIGIELANPQRQIVYLKEIVASDLFQRGKGRLLMALGQDIVGNPVITDLARMPHLLIAGATGTGKSVGLNSIICSLIYRMGPDRLRLLMIDPKRIELSLYDGIPHLIHPVVSDPKSATRALRWAVLEMERRYQLLEEAQARNLEGYNQGAEEPLPYLVIIIDELADLMMVSSKEVEAAIARLAQMARAAGIHLLIATQRPSVDVLTGLIKANFPARISFKVSTKVDSRTILDVMGAERLLGMGDMLFLPPGSSSLERIHGAYVSEAEIIKIVEHWKAQQEPEYDLSVLDAAEEDRDDPATAGTDGEKVDPMYDRAVEIVTQSGQASISGLQRRLRVGYNRAARMIEQMERDGIVTPTDSMGRRQVIARGYDEP